MYLKLNNISKSFRDRRGNHVPVIKDFGLQVGRGEFVCLVGPSGCGKTTILRMIAGLEPLTSGSIILNGRDITYAPPNKRGMAFVFQHYALFPHMNVYNNVAFGLRVRGLTKEDVAGKVKAALETVGLTGFEMRAPNELSGGQQQRVALARALVVEPQVLLCDEPLSNLDAALRSQMRDEIKALQRRLNITTIYVTHDEEEARFLADRVVEINSLQASCGDRDYDR